MSLAALVSVFLLTWQNEEVMSLGLVFHLIKR